MKPTNTEVPAGGSGVSVPSTQLLPTSSQDEHYPSLELFNNVNPGARALTHEDPNAFLVNTIVSDLPPRFGSGIHGVNLTTLNADVRGQLTLCVVVLGGGGGFINAPPERRLE